jgi:hypothetical protein
MLLAGDQVGKHPPGEDGALVEREQERLHLLERSAAHVALDVFNHRLVLLAEGPDSSTLPRASEAKRCGQTPASAAMLRSARRKSTSFSAQICRSSGVESVRSSLQAAAYQQLVRYMTAPSYRFVRVLPHPGSRPDAERLHEATHVLEVDLAKPTGGVNLLDLLERQIRAQRVWEVISPSPESTAGERGVAGWVLGVHHITVRVMLPLIARGIRPVVEHLARPGLWRIRVARYVQGSEEGWPLEAIYRDAKIGEIYEGANEVQKWIIVRKLYGRELTG